LSSSITSRLPGLARFEGEEVQTHDSFSRPTGSDELSDERLMVNICKGDLDALASLFRRYACTMRGIAYRVLRDVSEADDLLQDTFLLVHRLAGTFDCSKGTARFWILQMTYRRAISRRRYLTSRHFYTRLDLEDVETELADRRNPAAEIEDSIDARMKSGNLQKVFEKLSENQRQTLLLFFVEGYTFDEIAEKLGQSRGNIKNHYFRGLDRLRKHIFSGKLAGPRAV
jgi:RNA polymerase sigma-70 factor, ECF subfamily